MVEEDEEARATVPNPTCFLDPSNVNMQGQQKRMAKEEASAAEPCRYVTVHAFQESPKLECKPLVGQCAQLSSFLSCVVEVGRHAESKTRRLVTKDAKNLVLSTVSVKKCLVLRQKNLEAVCLAGNLTAGGNVISTPFGCRIEQSLGQELKAVMIQYFGQPTRPYCS